MLVSGMQAMVGEVGRIRVVEEVVEGRDYRVVDEV